METAMSQPTAIIRPLGLATVLAVGFGVAYAILGAWCYAIWEGFHPEGSVSESVVVQADGTTTTREIVVDDPRGNESLVVREDGTPLIEHNSYRRGYEKKTFRTLRGAEVTIPDNEPWCKGAGLGRPHEWPFMFPLNADSRVVRFFDYRSDPTVWYFIHDGVRDGHGYFVGYDSKSKNCVGYFGREGFRPDPPPKEAFFPMDGLRMANQAAGFFPLGQEANSYYYVPESDARDMPDWKLHMISADRLLEIDLRNRSVTTMMQSADLISLDMIYPAWSPKANLRHRFLVVRTSDRLLLFNAAGKQERSYVIPAELRGGFIIFYDLGNKTALVTRTRTLRDHTKREDLCWIDPAGKVLRRHEFCPAQNSKPFNERRNAWKVAPICPAPIAMALVATVGGPLDHLDAGAEPNYRSALRRSLSAQWPILLAVSALSAVLAGFCYRRQKRFAQPWTGVWVVAVFLGGLPGFVGYRFHRHWPTLEKCPACGRSVPRDREACSACRAEFPLPELKGTEVFA
jgi:hypothetical protein